MSQLKRQRSKIVLKIPAVKFKRCCSATSFAQGTAVQNADYCHAFGNIEKRYAFLSRLFCPPASGFAVKKVRIRLLRGVPMLSEHEKTPISTGNERLDQLVQSVPLYSDVPKMFQSQNPMIPDSAKK